MIELGVPVQRYLRIYLLACIALAFGYLVIHTGEPLRLNVGDAWTDASVVNAIESGDRRSVPEIIYGAVGTLVGAHRITVFRLLALVFSGVAAWLQFLYARRMWNDLVAIVATTLTTTSFLWLMFADSLHRPPIMHAACSLALWGVVRALETEQRRHYLAAFLGTFVCLATASSDLLFLPVGVLFTVYVKRGNNTWRIVAICVAAGLLAMLVLFPFAAEPSSWQLTLDQRVTTRFATLIRRYTVLLTPMLWITVGWAVWRALRARSVKAAFEDGTTWMLVAALVFAYLPPPHPESVTLRTQLMLPLYSIGSGILIARLFDHDHWLRRSLALAWCVAAPLWGFWLMFSHAREVLDRDDLARANEYLAHNDRNSFVMSNLLADGPIQAGFGRHAWTALHERDPSTAHLRMLELFDAIGTDYAHAVIFTTPGSRFVDRSIAQLSRRRLPSVDGWPYLVRGKINGLIEVFDQQVLGSLEAVGAKRVLHLSNFDIYRIDRSGTLEAAAQSLPVVKRIDFDSLAAVRHQLLGWGDPLKSESRTTLSSVAGYAQCRNQIASSLKPAPNRCAVVERSYGLDALDVGGITRAELMVRVERVCDQQLTITLAAPAKVDVAVNGVPVLRCGDPQWGTATASVRVPQQHVHSGLNIISFHDRQGEPKQHRPELTSVVIEPISCPGQEQLPAPDPAP